MPMNGQKRALVIFGETLPRSLKSGQQYDIVVAPEKLSREIKAVGFQWQSLEELVEPGSIYEASAFAEELSRLKLPDGTRLTKSFTYEGYELWWMYYNSLFLYFCLPYTQYKGLLHRLKDFTDVHFCQPPYKSLFFYYLRAYGCKVKRLTGPGLKSPSFLPFGIFIQIIVTLLCLPVLILKRRRLMVFIGDKFEKSRDYDFRMKFIYRELRSRNLPFVEFIRSLESWKKIIHHALIRRRPVVYSEGVAFLGRFCGFISGGHILVRRKIASRVLTAGTDPETRFKFLIGAHYILGMRDDVWAIRIMKLILRAIGIKTAFIAAALDRNFHAFLGCKLNAIPTVGILHGVASKYYNGYDFLPGFDGEKMLSVDKYGLWSQWWKEYYVKNSKAYRPEQLYVSGPMRPSERNDKESADADAKISAIVREGPINVLFVSEQLAVPQEVMPYLEALLGQSDIRIILTFRHYRDGFKEWLLKNKPELLEHPNIKVAAGGLQKAIEDSDVAVGSHSTAVLEMLLQLKPPIFFQTQKWGDYYNLREYGEKRAFFAENPAELTEKIKNARSASADTLKDLQERYFGDPYKNGSKWVVDEMISSAR